MRDALGNVQSVLVLGGDSDIAFATINQLVQRRTKTVILAGRNLQQLEWRASRLRDLGLNEVSTVEFDALDFERHAAFVESVFESVDDIDLVLLAFGVLGNQLDDELNADRALNTIRSNYVGAVSVLIPIVKKLRSQGHGTIVIMSTVAIERPRRSNFIYGSSKAGLDWFAQGMADALQGSGVHVMLVRPGFVMSKMTAGMKKPPLATTPDQVANTIVRGLSRNSEIVWVPGRLRWIMSFIRHLPRSVFRKLNL